ncbi:tRNA:m(4)X modification enzyme TRM13 homolog [Babylonia areolata]|uniref:tRNA:m(4)X modification enzyme TRM13 homolog n=1 Tax=Babylonia areolata TaxID=304850 RepID=UPI003FD59CD7
MSDAPQPVDGQCAFFLPRKKRFCRFRPIQDQKYCPEHACVMGVALERKRIVCPLNPKHTCYEDNLDKHLKKCNSRKRGSSEEYYEEGINAGSDEGDCVVNTQTAVKSTNTERLRQMIEKVNKLYAEHIGTVEEDVRSHDCLRQEMDNPYFGLSALRHRRQQASLIGQLEGLGLLAPGHCYVEMGAGKGQLSHWVRQAVSSHDDAAFLLVDRSSIRYKVDGYHKEEEKVKFERIKMDIEHLRLGKVPMVANSQRPLVAIGKHLCGAATDLTLRCLMETVVPSTSPDSSTSEPNPKRSRLDEAASATTTTSSSEPDPADATSSQASSVNCSDGHRSQTLSSRGEGADTQTLSDDSVKCGGLKGKLGAAEDGKRAGVSDPATKVKGQQTPGGQQRRGENAGQTDSLSDPPPLVESGGDSGKAVATEKRVVGVLIALCCHHQCGWRPYVGKRFMRQCQLTADDFHLLTRLTSWAVCGWRDRDGSFGTREQKDGSGSRKEGGGDSTVADKSTEQTTSSQPAENDGAEEEEREHNTADLVSGTDTDNGLQLTEKEKERVGWRCKRLIDYGRVCYLRDQGLGAQLKVYIDAGQTPENVVLVATPPVHT